MWKSSSKPSRVGKKDHLPRERKSSCNGSGNQRTLLQCWTKREVTSLRSADGIEVIDLEDERVQCNITSSPNENVADVSEIQHQFRPHFTVFAQTSRGSVSSKFKKEWNGYVGNRNGGRRCPFYKRVADTPYVVDAFNYAGEEQIKGYFLSHFHSDHYAGLGARFSRPVYCSEVTAKLVQLKLSVPEKFINALSLDEWTTLPDGTRVNLLNSNHCPGAVLFVFQLRNGRVIVHTGDMRADESVLQSTKMLFRDLPRVQTLHLDTTYCDAIYSFPPQSEVIEELVRRVQSELRQRSKLLIVVGAYQIGKERVFRAIAEALDLKIFVQRDKRNVLACLKDMALSERLTLDPHKTSLHVLGMGSLNCETLAEYLRGFSSTYDSVLGISATGWEFGRSGAGWRVTRRGNTTVIGAPYSEHSSYVELKRFVQLVRPVRVIPTVNVGNEATRKKMQEIIAQWLKEDGLGEVYEQKRIGGFLANS